MAELEQILSEYQTARAWLYSLVTDPTGSRFFIPKDQETLHQTFIAQLERTRRFLAFCDDPQTRFRSVHVAGTSGKGSVTVLIARLLQACGQKTADHTSPYLQVANEKLRLDGMMIRPSQFTQLVRQFQTLYAQWQAEGEWLKYGEAWVALTYLWFAQQQPDWGIIETGLGGRFDPTNVLPSQLAVITNINYDHLDVLGQTLPQVAWHKAGIIKEGMRVISAETKPAPAAIIEREIVAKGARYHPLRYEEHDDNTITIYAPFADYRHIAVPMRGQYQKQNAATAIAAVDWLAHDFGFPLTANAIQAGLADVIHHGRFEVMQNRPTVILDGAHNPHKMSALIESVQAQYPQRKLAWMLGFIANKAADEMLTALCPIAHELMLCEPQVFGKPPQSAEQLAKQVQKIAPQLPCTVCPSLLEAIPAWLAQASPDDVLIITGSIYLIGQAREFWHSSQTILESAEKQWAQQR